MAEELVIQEKKRTSLLKRCAFFCLKLCSQLLKLGFVLIIASIGVLIIIDLATSYSVKNKIYTDINQLPKYETALVLGTAKYYSKGVPNLYYKYRLESALALIQKGKVKHLLVSGDNQTPYYNEPKVMTNDLQKMGISDQQITQDFAGINTLNSIVRADKVFKVSPFIIVSQQFHCERALFIAQMRHIDAVCFVAKYPEGHIKVRLREFLARAGMIWNYIFDIEPLNLEQVKSK